MNKSCMCWDKCVNVESCTTFPHLHITAAEGGMASKKTTNCLDRNAEKLDNNKWYVTT